MKLIAIKFVSTKSDPIRTFMRKFIKIASISIKIPSKPSNNARNCTHTATFKHTFSLIQKKSLLLKWIAFLSSAAGLVRVIHHNEVALSRVQNLGNYSRHISRRGGGGFILSELIGWHWVQLVGVRRNFLVVTSLASSMTRAQWTLMESLRSIIELNGAKILQKRF